MPSIKRTNGDTDYYLAIMNFSYKLSVEWRIKHSKRKIRKFNPEKAKKNPKKYMLTKPGSPRDLTDVNQSMLKDYGRE